MRGYVPGYEVKSPATLAEALELTASHPGIWRPLAGGTDLMVLLEMGTLEHRKYLNIQGLSELRGIQVHADKINIRALTTFRQIRDHSALQHEFPMLCEAARNIGSIAIQNRGTIGGNIANSSPAADSPPALLAYDAQIELVSHTGSRWLPYSQFHAGYKKTQMRPDELIRSICLPRSHAGANSRFEHYRKVGTRAAQAISKTCFAGWISFEQLSVSDVRLAYGSVAATPVRCAKTEQLLRGKILDRKLVIAAKETLAQEISPIDDIRSTAEYRLRVSLNLLEDFLISAQSRRSKDVELGK